MAPAASRGWHVARRRPPFWFFASLIAIEKGPGFAYGTLVVETLATQLAVVTGEIMNLAALVRRGDDAAWSGIGPDADIRVVSELVAFADLARRAGQAVEGTLSLGAAADCAMALGEEIRTTGVPVSERARVLASELLEALGVGVDVLRALDGDAGS